MLFTFEASLHALRAPEPRAPTVHVDFGKTTITGWRTVPCATR
jgi:hypothetical protein